MPVHIDELQTDIELLASGSSGGSRTDRPAPIDVDRLRQNLRPLIEAEIAAAYEAWRRTRR